MIRCLVLSAITLNLVTATAMAAPNSCPYEYCYDAATGTCHNADGDLGRNVLSAAQIETNRSAQCAQLHKSYFVAKGGFVPAEAAARYTVIRLPTFNGLDLQGADLSESTAAPYAFIMSAKLQGTDLTGLVLAYAKIGGQADIYTKPAARPCPQKMTVELDGSLSYYCSH